jgi:importin subunit alpha-1
LWALFYISDGGDEKRVDAVLRSNANVAKMLVDIVGDDSNPKMLTPALKTVGNIVHGNDNQTQAMIAAGLLLKMSFLLNHESTKKEALWVLSNIAAGTEQQIGEVLGMHGCMKAVTKMAMDKSATWEVRKEAIWTVCNVARCGNNLQVQSIVDVECGAIDAVCSVFDINDTEMVMVALDALDRILRVGQEMNMNKDYCRFVYECDGLEKLEKLQEHSSDDIYRKAVNIIETFFGCEDGTEDENLAPSVRVQSGEYDRVLVYTFIVLLSHCF